MDKVWRDVLSEIKTQVSGPIFLTFFKESKLITLTNNNATVSVPTDIGAEYVEKRYYSLVKDAFKKVKIGNMGLNFISQEKIQTLRIGRLEERTTG